MDDLAVRDILDHHWGISPLRLTRLESELATVRRIDLADRPVVFKAYARHDIDYEILTWQSDAIGRLVAAGLPVPRLLPAVDGRETVRSRYRDRDIVVQLGEWRSGTPLADVSPTSATLRDIGATSARIVQALSAHPLPPVPVHHIWELARTAETLAEVRPQISDPAVLDLVDIAANRFADQVMPRLPFLTSGVVHHDLNDFNVLVEPGPDGPRVSGILDFGDLVTGPRIAELIVASAYAGRLLPEPGPAMLCVARGWLNHLPIDEAEAAVLLPGAIARLAVNLGVYTSRQQSDRASYAADRVELSFDTLERLLRVDTHRFISDVLSLA